MQVETQQTYSEVYQVIELMGNKYISKLPNKLIKMLEEKRDITYNPKYTFDVPLNSQKIKRESIAMICLIYLNYWCENQAEKNEILTTLKNNEERYQEKIREKYNPDKIFEKDDEKEQKEESKENSVEEVAMVQYKESLIKKIINKIKGLFRR